MVLAAAAPSVLKAADKPKVGQGFRFIDYPEFIEIPSEYVGIDEEAEDYQLVRMTLDWEPRTDYPTMKVREVRRPELEKRMLHPLGVDGRSTTGYTPCLRSATIQP